MLITALLESYSQQQPSEAGQQLMRRGAERRLELRWLQVATGGLVWCRLAGLFTPRCSELASAPSARSLKSRHGWRWRVLRRPLAGYALSRAGPAGVPPSSKVRSRCLFGSFTRANHSPSARFGLRGQRGYAGRDLAAQESHLMARASRCRSFFRSSCASARTPAFSLGQLVLCARAAPSGAQLVRPAPASRSSLPSLDCRATALTSGRRARADSARASALNRCKKRRALPGTGRWSDRHCSRAGAHLGGLERVLACSQLPRLQPVSQATHKALDAFCVQVQPEMPRL